MESFQASNTLG